MSSISGTTPHPWSSILYIALSFSVRGTRGPLRVQVDHEVVTARVDTAPTRRHRRYHHCHDQRRVRGPDDQKRWRSTLVDIGSVHLLPVG